MVKCTKCGKTYQEADIACFNVARIPLNALCCERCLEPTLVRTTNTSLKEESCVV